MALSKVGTFSGSSITNFDIDNVFSSSYDIYEIKLKNLDFVDGQNNSWYMRFIDGSGSVVSSSTYSSAGTNWRTDSDSWGYQNAQNDITYGNIGFAGGYSDDMEGQTDIRIFNPYDSNIYTQTYSEIVSWHSSGFAYIYRMANVEKTKQSIRGVRLYANANFANVEAEVWGYA